MIREPRPAWERLLRAKSWLAIALVTAVSVVLIGGVVVATTNLGAKSAANHSPLPFFAATPSAKGGAFTVPASAYPPVNNPATYYPPVNNPASYYPPSYPPGSQGQFPQIPFYPALSGGGGVPLGLNCTIPVFEGPPGSGGFVSFPAATYTADPRSAVSTPSPGPQQGPGYGYSGAGMTYDRIHSRWLPVAPQMVSPDGNHYAYGSNGHIYVVDTTNGSQFEIPGVVGVSWSLLRVLDDRVYATKFNLAGFWSIPFKGGPVLVTGVGYWQAATSDSAFGTSTLGAPASETQQLLRLNIATGDVFGVFAVTGATLNVLGVDSTGHPIVQSSSANSWGLWIVHNAAYGSLLADSDEGFYIQGTMVADSHGLWFPIYVQNTSVRGLALLVPESGIYVMESNVYGQPAGGCA